MASRVDLVTLSVFIAVIEESSLAKAAERVHLAPSALSKRLADLELNLNVKLFERKPTGMFPTAAGTALLHHARLIIRNVDELEAEMVDFAGGMRGTIRVQANATAMTSYLPDDLTSFLALFPHVRIEIEESTTTETLRAIAENAADIGIYGDAVVPTEFSSFVYRPDRLVLLVPNGHPLESIGVATFEQATPYEFIGPPRGSSIETAMFRAAADLGVSLKMTIRSSGFDAISRLVDVGLGITVMPESVTALYSKSMAVKAVPLDEKWAYRRLMICVRDHNALTPPAAAFFAHLTRPRD